MLRRKTKFTENHTVSGNDSLQRVRGYLQNTTEGELILKLEAPDGEVQLRAKELLYLLEHAESEKIRTSAFMKLLAKMHFIDLIEYMHSIDLDYRSIQGKGLFETACELGDVEVVNWMLENHENPERTIIDGIFAAASHEQMGVLGFLLGPAHEGGCAFPVAKCIKEGKSLLSVALLHNQTKLATALLASEEMGGFGVELDDDSIQLLNHPVGDDMQKDFEYSTKSLSRLDSTLMLQTKFNHAWATYDDSETIGSGTYGIVRLFVTGEEVELPAVAVKSFAGTGFADQTPYRIFREYDDIRQEARMMQDAYPDYIYKLKHFVSRGSEPGMYNYNYRFVMPYFKGASLFAHIKETPDLHEFMRIILAIAEELARLHAKEIVHGDARMTNILVDKQDNDYVVRLVDFAFAKHQGLSKNTFATKDQYCAPETITKADGSSPLIANCAQDVYTFATVANLCIDYWVYCHDKNDDLGFRKQLHAEYPGLNNLLRRSSAENPWERPSMQEYVNCINSYKWVNSLALAQTTKFSLDDSIEDQGCFASFTRLFKGKNDSRSDVKSTVSAEREHGLHF